MGGPERKLKLIGELRSGAPATSYAGLGVLKSALARLPDETPLPLAAFSTSATAPGPAPPGDEPDEAEVLRNAAAAAGVRLNSARDVALALAEMDALRAANASLEARLAAAQAAEPSASSIFPAEFEALQAACVALKHDCAKIGSTARAVASRFAAVVLSPAEVEEAAMKCCWLARYWGLACRHNIYPELSHEQHRYWQGLSPPPAALIAAARAAPPAGAAGPASVRALLDQAKQAKPQAAASTAGAASHGSAAAPSGVGALAASLPGTHAANVAPPFAAAAAAAGDHHAAAAGPSTGSPGAGEVTHASAAGPSGTTAAAAAAAAGPSGNQLTPSSSGRHLSPSPSQTVSPGQQPSDQAQQQQAQQQQAQQQAQQQQQEEVELGPSILGHLDAMLSAATCADFIEIERALRQLKELGIEAAVHSAIAEAGRLQRLRAPLPTALPGAVAADSALSSSPYNTSPHLFGGAAFQTGSNAAGLGAPGGGGASSFQAGINAFQNAMHLELTPEEVEDVQFRSAWLAFLWARAAAAGVAQHVAGQRAEYWRWRLEQPASLRDASVLAQGFQELAALGVEQQLWYQRAANGGGF